VGNRCLFICFIFIWCVIYIDVGNYGVFLLFFQLSFSLCVNFITLYIPLFFRLSFIWFFLFCIIHCSFLVLVI
jgi:hypothetical protein